MMTTEPSPPPLSDALLDPTAVVVTAPPPEGVLRLDPTWRIVEPDLQPSGVQLAVLGGQVAFELTQAIDEPTALRLTTEDASGPYRLRDSFLMWRTDQLPDVWGGAESRVQLRGDDGTATEHSIDVVFAANTLTVSHTDSGTTTVDATRPLTSTTARPGAPPEQFQWLRIESDAAGEQFWVYASLDGFTWVLLVRAVMSLDMQAAFAATTISFSMSASGIDASGRWTIGSINVQPNAMQFAGLYLQSEDQAGYSYNRGVWAQFGAPLDGTREDYVFDSATGDWYDTGGHVHYEWISALAYAQDDPNTLYAAVVNRVFLFVSHDGGFTWQARRMSFTDGTQSSPATRPDETRLNIFHVASPERGEILVSAYASNATDDPGIYHSTDEGVTWTRITPFTEYHPTGTPSGTLAVRPAGGMRASSGKVWWGEQTAETTTAITADVPNYRVLWSGAMEWFVDIDDKPADAPYLAIPTLPDASEWTDVDGVVHTGTVTLVTFASHGAWNPEVFGSAVLWEDGLQYPFQNPVIEGIYGAVGTATPVRTQLLWQPASVPDSDLDAFWSLTDNMLERNRQIKGAQQIPPLNAPPPPLPDLGTGMPGVSPALSSLSRNSEDRPEPVNSQRGIRFDATAPPGYDGNQPDFEHTVTPHRPENCADVRQLYIRGPGQDGAKLHVVVFDDVTLPSAPGAPAEELNSERKAAYAMSGVLTVTVLDAGADELSLLEQRGAGGAVYATGTTTKAVGSSQWAIVGGDDGGESYPAVAIIGPPGFEQPVDYFYDPHATWIFEDQANYPTPLPPLDIATGPGVPGPGTEFAGGLWVASLVAFDTTTPAIPDGWTVVDDSSATSSSHPAAAGGKYPKVGPPRERGYGQWADVETGEWGLYDDDGVFTEGGLARARLRLNVTYDLGPISVVTITRPVDWAGADPLPVELPEPSASYWFLSCAVGVYGIASGSASWNVTSATWAVKRANFDGTSPETVGVLTFGPDPTDPLVGFAPNSLQIRPQSDDLCLVSTFFGNGVWRVRAGAGAQRIWTASLGGQPWDAVPLDDATYLAAASAVPPGVSGTAYVFASSDAGANWQIVETIPPEQSFAPNGAPDSYQMLALASGDLNQLAMLGMASNTVQQIVWESSNRGATWSQNLNYADGTDSGGSYVVGGPGGLVAVQEHRVVVRLVAVPSRLATILG